MQSLLEANGIPTFIKNQFSSSVMGEVPFVEVCPQLYILDAADLNRARRILPAELPGAEPTEDDWVCPDCGETIGSQFGQCWNCAEGDA